MDVLYEVRAGLFYILLGPINLEWASSFLTVKEGIVCTKFRTIYRKYVLHLLKYIFAVYLSRRSTNLRYILGHSVLYNMGNVFLGIQFF